MDFETRDFRDITGHEGYNADAYGCVTVKGFREDQILVRARGIQIYTSCTPQQVFASLRGLTDSEHSSVHCFRFPVVGLEFERLRGRLEMSGYIQPQNDTPFINGAGEFRVPPSDFSPFDDAEPCQEDGCGEHAIINRPIIEHDEELYEKVEGKQIEITIPTC